MRLPLCAIAGEAPATNMPAKFKTTKYDRKVRDIVINSLEPENRLLLSPQRLRRSRSVDDPEAISLQTNTERSCDLFHGTARFLGVECSKIPQRSIPRINRISRWFVRLFVPAAVAPCLSS